MSIKLQDNFKNTLGGRFQFKKKTFEPRTDFAYIMIDLLGGSFQRTLSLVTFMNGNVLNA